MVVAVGKMIDRAHGTSKRKTSYIAANMGDASARTSDSREYVRRRVCHVIKTGSVIFSLVPSVGVVDLRNGQVHVEFCPTRNCLTFCHGGVQVAFENRSTATAVQITFLASKCEQKRAGCTITRTRLEKESETAGRRREPSKPCWNCSTYTPSSHGGRR